jgi:hypothetical protein
LRGAPLLTRHSLLLGRVMVSVEAVTEEEGIEGEDDLWTSA